MDERYVQQVIKHRHLAEDERRPQPARRPRIDRPQEKQRRAKRHQKIQQRRRIFSCIQKREHRKGGGFLCAPAFGIAIDIERTQGDESNGRPMPAGHRNARRRSDGQL